MLVPPVVRSAKVPDDARVVLGEPPRQTGGPQGSQQQLVDEYGRPLSKRARKEFYQNQRQSQGGTGKVGVLSAPSRSLMMWERLSAL